MKRWLMMTLILCSCTTPLHEKFSKVDLGMDKTDVIDEVGSPHHTYRRNDQDIWIYQYQTEESAINREVAFKNGFVSYVGEPRQREKVSAGAAKTEEEAAKILETEIKKKKKPAENFQDIKEDGSF